LSAPFENGANAKLDGTNIHSLPLEPNE